MSPNPRIETSHATRTNPQRITAFEFAALLLLFASFALLEVRSLSSLTAIAGNRIWLHLRTGLWILENHSLPRTGLFSQFAARSWVDSTWAFDLVVACFYKVFDLRALPILLMICRVKLAILVFLLAGGLRAEDLPGNESLPVRPRTRFWGALFLTAVAQYAFAKIPLTSDYVSILFFSFELLWLGEIRRTGSRRVLYTLPVLFMAWANFDPHFVFGILAMLLFLATLAVRALPSAGLQSPEPAPARGAIVLSALLCLVASCVTPYGYRPYSVFLEGFSSATRLYVPDLHALGFRQPQNYVLMLLVMGAFLALGLRRSRDPFQILLLTTCTILAFRAQRFAWLGGIAAVAVLGATFDEPLEPETLQQPSQICQLLRSILLTGFASMLIVLAAALVAIPRSHDALLRIASKTYPVAACDFLRANRLPPPLFNSIEWGSFVAWYLPEDQVSLDTRAGLYSDDEIVRYYKAMNAEIPYSDYPPMNQAATLLLPRHASMGEALATVPGFRLTYEDDVAIVLSH